MQEGIS